MFTRLQARLSFVFLKIFLRDRQMLFWSLFFPIIFMTVFGFVNDQEQEPIDVGVVNLASSDVAQDFAQQLIADPLFTVTEGDEQTLREQLVAGDQTMVLVLPEGFDADSDNGEIRVLVDAAQVQQLSLIMPILEQKLIAIERAFRGIEAMFSISLEDVQARSQRYLDFLLPGLLSFTIMQLAIAGSGFNIVEYRRKGILKRLFVTPIQPRDFIAAIAAARTVIVLIQLTVLIAFAVFILKVQIIGSFIDFFLVVLLSTFIFLNIGFCLGSIAKTQQAIGAIGNIVIFPQIFLSGVFYPIESMPELIQPVAYVLPLSFVSTGLREIANEGASIMEIVPSLAGIAVWLVISFILAARLFVWKEIAN